MTDRRSREREEQEHATRVRDLDRHVVAIGIGLLIIGAILWLVPAIPLDQTAGITSDEAHARIESIVPSTDQAPPSATIEFIGGERAGQRATADIEGPSGQLLLPDYRVGDEVLVAIDHAPDGSVTISVLDLWRLPVLQLLAAVLGLLAAMVAGFRGLRALVTLAMTVVVTIKILIPLLLLGWNPVLLAVGIGVAVTTLGLLLTQGISRTTLAAIGGTTVSLALTGVLAQVAAAAARFTPAQGSEHVVYLQQLLGDRIDLGGLLLAAVIFGSLGVLNDVAVGQAATVSELRDLGPGISQREVFQRTMNVGVAHLTATLNTLIFAYLGFALPLLVLLSLQVSTIGLSINEEIIAVEIVRTIVGSIGILLAVPITTAIATALHPPVVSLPPSAA
jgi:uncharacterized membrane protein